MPNWCINQTEISHSVPSMMERLNKAFEDGLFEEFLPTPVFLLEGDGWHSWRVNNWGTKWDVSLQEGGTFLFDNENKSILTFDTAWSPPIEFYEHLKTLGYEIKSYYWEPGMGFCGIYTNDGLEEYDQDEDIPHDLDEVMNISSWLAECREEENESQDS